MSPFKFTQSDWFAIAMGLAIAIIAGRLLFGFVGWLGVGILGLMGLVVSVRMELYDEHAVGTSEHGSGTVDMLVQQRRIAEESRRSPEEKMKAAASRSKRVNVLYLVNTACIAMVALGFGMFFLHDL
jgi:hypothetical protein